jgi:hypothetical protein
MTHPERYRPSRNVSRLLAVVAAITFNFSANAQNPAVQQRVEELKQAGAKNKQNLAQYTWAEQVTISLKGEEKKQEHFQVRVGPDGQQQKTSLDPPPASTEPSGGRLKKHIVEKKKEEYKDYADEMKALAQQYVPPTPELLQKALQAGNITLGTEAGDPNVSQIVIHSYLKPNDTVTLDFDRINKALTGIKIASYMDDPSDAMNLTVQFSRLPDGTNHVSNLAIDGVKKQLNVAIANSNYQHV